MERIESCWQPSLTLYLSGNAQNAQLLAPRFTRYE